MPDVFISYKREERGTVSLIAAALTDLGVDTWFDAHLAPGAYFNEELQREAQAAKAILVCWTPAAITSAWVMEEARIGLLRACLVPIELKPTELPADFARLHVEDLCDWKGALHHEGWIKTLRSIGKHIGDPQLAQRSLARAGGETPVMVTLMRRLLVAKARARETYTYKQAEAALRASAEADGIELPSLVQQTMWGALDKIAEQNSAAREPPLCALVVSERSGRPGRGYFQKHCFLDGADDPLAEPVHRRQLERVYAHRWDG